MIVAVDACFSMNGCALGIRGLLTWQCTYPFDEMS